MNHQNRFWSTSLMIVLALAFLFQVNCGGGMGGTTAKQVVYPMQATPEMEALFQRIEEQYRRRSYDYAFTGYQNFIESYGHTRLTDEAYYKQGKILFLTKRYAEATKKFNELAIKSPDPAYQSKALHMAGYAFFLLDNHVDALANFEKIQDQALPTRMRAQLYSLVIQSVEQAQTEVSFGDLNKVKLFALYEDTASQSIRNLAGGHILSYARARMLFESWVDAPMGVTEIPMWMKKNNISILEPYFKYKFGRVYNEAGDAKKARKYLTEFVSLYPKNMYFSPAQKLLAELGGADDTIELKQVNFKIGVLLPLTGRYESYANSVLDGLKCAAGTDNACGDFSGVELIIKDSGPTPLTAKAAIEQLVTENVAAVVGPLSGAMALEAGVVASTNKVPIFPITQKTGLMTQGDYIFQIGMQPQQQIEALVRAARSRGLKNFGMFYPNNNYGQTMAALFRDEVDRQGGKITAEAEYNRRSPDPFAEVRKLKRNIGRLASAAGAGFDALFIPDSYKSINNIVGGLEFNKITGVPLLGTNAWNDPGLSLMIASKFPGSFFIDLYDGNSKAGKVTEFKEKFVGSFGRNPRVLEAYGYDILNLIRSIASQSGPNKIKSYLESNRGFSGVTGIRGFNIGVKPVVDSRVLKIRESGVAE